MGLAAPRGFSYSHFFNFLQRFCPAPGGESPGNTFYLQWIRLYLWSHLQLLRRTYVTALSSLDRGTLWDLETIWLLSTERKKVCQIPHSISSQQDWIYIQGWAQLWCQQERAGTYSPCSMRVAWGCTVIWAWIRAAGHHEPGPQYLV